MLAIGGFEDATGTVATDFSGYGSTGTLVDGSLGDWSEGVSGNWLNPGKLGDAIDFAENGRVEVASDTTNFLSGLDGASFISMSFWIKVNAVPIGSTNRDYAVIISTGDNVGPTIRWEDDQLEIAGRSQPSDTFKGDGATFTDTTSWHHMVGVWDIADDTGYLYVDGELFYTYSLFAFVGSVYTPNLAGTGVSTIANGLDAKLDDVRIYDRELSVTEIANLYARSSYAKREGGTNLKNLVGYWPMDEGSGTGIEDFTGQGNNGTLSVGTSPLGWVDGKFGSGVDFDGEDDGIDMGNVLGQTGSFSVSAWINPDDLSSTGQRIIAKDSNAKGWAFSFGDGGASKVRFFTRETTGGSIVTDSAATITSTSTWYHVVGVFDTNADTRTIYIDGVEDGQVTNVTGTPDDSFANLTIGKAYLGGSYFDGRIDDVRIFNRALTAGEVENLYNADARVTRTRVNMSQRNVLTDGLVGYWTFDGKDLTTTTASDVSGNGNDGTLTNGPTPARGKIGQALSFDRASNTRINLAHSSSTSFGEDFTLSTWIKYPVAFTQNATFFGKGSGPRNYQFFLGPGGVPEFTFRDIDTLSCTARSSSAFNDNTWHHVVGVRNTLDDKCYVFVDGVKLGEGVDASVGTITNSATAYIGDRYGTGVYDWDGGIDEVRFYNRALSADEIWQLYNMGK